MDNLQSSANAEFAQLAKTLGNAHRLSLLDHLAQGERRVERLAEITEMSLANTSQHLLHLKRVGLVDSSRDGKYVVYRLSDGPVVPLLAALRQFVEFQRESIHALVRSANEERDGVEPVSRSELRELLVQNAVTLLDVRPEEEFKLGHIPGAINIQVSDIEQRLEEFAAETQIVAYCRGPYCLLSVDAVRILRENGLSVKHMQDGYPEWKAAGMAVSEN